MIVSRRNILFAAALFFGVNGCDSSEVNDTPHGGTSLGYGLEEAFSSKLAFETALNKSGTAQGSGYSGSYSVIFRGGKFSSECTPAFVRANDFYVNDSAPDEVLLPYLQEITPDYEVSITIQQEGGRLTLNADGDGPESPLSGWIDADGTFQALLGQYDDVRNFWVAGHAGRIDGDEIVGVFAARIKRLDDATATGSCQWSAGIVAAP